MSHTPERQPRKRFALAGRSAAIDPRIDPVRRDLADVRVAARVFAPHYAAAIGYSAVVKSWVRAEKGPGAGILSQLLPGDAFDALEIAHGCVWGVSRADGVVGYVDLVALGDRKVPTHIVSARHAAVRTSADIGSAIVATLPMGACVVASDTHPFAETTGGFMATSDLHPLGVSTLDPVDAASAMIGAPFFTGGRSGDGVDADGLVFLACQVAGVKLPRFRDLQQAGAGHSVDGGSSEPGDLIFFADHVAILVDTATAIHADPVAGGVRREPLAAMLADDRFGPIVARRRLP